MLNAAFITPKTPITCPVLFRDFDVSDTAGATLEITGLGLYRAKINGQRVGADYLSPGCNDYFAYLRYQTYDVSQLLKPGKNRIEVALGDGWYKGRFGLNSGGGIFGDRYLLSAKLTLADAVIETDASWQALRSTITETSIYDGEHRDDTILPGEPLPCEAVEANYPLMPDFAPTVKAKLTLNPTLITSPKGEQILDFGQNMVGVVRIKNRLPKGAKLKLSFGEVLQGGCFYRDNLRSAKAEYSYVSGGVETDVEPLFTFYGFRYALVERLGQVDPADFTGVVLYSDLRQTLSCETDSPKINQLMQNALWGQRGNFVDVPTDCPQRDERLGWTADTQVFVNTACYQMDCKDFYKKFMRDMRADQTLYYQGDIPMYSPSLKGGAGPGGAVWADAGTIVPWHVYQFYGDKQLLEENWPMMRDYVQTLIKKDDDQGGAHIVNFGFTFGDWLALDGVNEQAVKGGTDDGYIQAVYYWNSVHLVALAAAELGYEQDAARYEKLACEIKQALLDEYFSPNGRLCVDTQTGYVLALHFGLFRDREKTVADFQNRLKRDAFKLKSGFTGTPLMLPVMLDNGMDDDAFRLLFNEKYPGWLYCVNLGATTIWERWNSLLPDGSISGTGMNSLNHYAYGSVCEAIYSRIAGLRQAQPGWRRAIVEPHINWRMKRIRVKYDSPAGRYEVAWALGEDGNLKLDVVVPDGASATVILPDHPESAKCEVGAGKHSYQYRPATDHLHPFSANSRIFDVMGNDKANAAFKAIMPRMYAAETGEDSAFAFERLADVSHFLPFISTDALPELDRALRDVKV